MHNSKEFSLLGLDSSGSGPLLTVSIGRNEYGELLAAMIGRLQEGLEIYCLDAGNCFDPFPLAVATRALGLPAEAFLEQVYVSRAATCHQIVSVVEEMLLPLRPGPDRKMVLVLGIDTLFVDEDIQLFERRYLYERILEGIAKVHASGIPCIVTYNHGLEEQERTRLWHTLLQRALKNNQHNRLWRGLPTAPPKDQHLEDNTHGKNVTDIHTLPGKGTGKLE